MAGGDQDGINVNNSKGIKFIVGHQLAGGNACCFSYFLWRAGGKDLLFKMFFDEGREILCYHARAFGKKEWNMLVVHDRGE